MCSVREIPIDAMPADTKFNESEKSKHECEHVRCVQFSIKFCGPHATYRIVVEVQRLDTHTDFIGYIIYVGRVD